jgi:hypothetical protein
MEPYVFDNDLNVAHPSTLSGRAEDRAGHGEPAEPLNDWNDWNWLLRRSVMCQT